MVDRAVLVTGCSSGIGRATAERLATLSDWTVFASARRIDSIADLAETGCRLVELDVTDDESARAAVNLVEVEFGGVSGLVNNAGYSQSGALETLGLDMFRRQLETNLIGALRLSQLVLPGMRALGFGRIINISSMGGVLEFPGGGAYHASKHALETLSDVLRWEVEGFGVDVIVIEPGLVKTGFADAATASLEDLESGAYAELNAAVGAITRNAYEQNSLMRFGATPSRVAKRVAKALTAKRPKTRYRTDLAGRTLIWTRRLATDRMWDRLMRRNYPQPGR